MCAELYVTGKMYVSEIVAKYNISDLSVLKRWIIASTPKATAKNILKRDFYALEPNKKWSTDVSEFKNQAKTRNYILVQYFNI